MGKDDDRGARPYVVLSCAISVDGYLDDATDQRLILSGADDLDRVDEVRAGCDAILVGANTVRKDNPRLVLRSSARQAQRAARSQAPHPMKVTVTRSGDLDPDAGFFTAGDAEKLVYAASPAAPKLRAELRGRGEVIDAGDPVRLDWLLDHLASRGVRRLMAEGGAQILGWFLNDGLADELQLVVAPVFVGDPTAPHWAPGGRPARSAHGGAGGVGGAGGHLPAGRMRLLQSRAVGDCVLLRYDLRPAPTRSEPRGHASDREQLSRAIELSRRCPPSTTAFSVGALLVDAEGAELATGFSREADPAEHAEEAALRKVDPADPRLAGATMYSSLEPCGARASRPRTCAELIIAAGVRRVVYALREPARFVDGQGDEMLRRDGVEVIELSDLAAPVREVNAHLLS